MSAQKANPRRAVARYLHAAAARARGDEYRRWWHHEFDCPRRPGEPCRCPGFGDA